MENKKGAVTVFLVLITMVMFMLAGAVIDLSRCLLAKYTVDSALDSATRSLMSNYDKELVSEYSLYAIDGSNADNKKTLTKYLKNNLELSSKNTESSAFSLLKLDSSCLKEDSISIAYHDKLVEDQVFRDEVMDYMRIKGPVMITNSIFDVAKDFFVAGKMDELSKAKDAKDKSDNAKSESKDSKKAVEKVNETKEKINNAKVTNPNWSKAKENIKETFEGKSFGEEAGKLGKNALKETLTTGVKKGAKLINKAIDDSLIDNLNTAVAEAEGKLANLESSIGAATSQINAANASLTGGYTVAGESISEDSSIDAGKYVSGSTSDFSNATKQVEAAKKKLEDLKTKISENKTKAINYSKDYNTLGEIYCICETVRLQAEFLDENGIEYDLNDLISVANEEINKKKGNIVSSDVKKNFTITIDNYQTIAGTVETEINSVISKQNKAINAITSISVDSIDVINVPEEKEDYEGKDKQENDEAKVEDSMKQLESNLKTYASNDISSFRLSPSPGGYDAVSNIFAALPVTNVISTVTDFASTLWSGDYLYNVYLTEYIYDKTNFITSSVRRNHFFKYGEMEYVKYGWNKQWQNVLNSVSSVISLRYTINFVYYFFKTPGEAIIKLISAAVEAAIQTAFDSVELFITSGKCAFLPGKSNLQFTYSDYLKLSVMLETGKQERMIDTIQASLKQRDKTGKFDITNMYTSVETKCVVEVDLIFMKLLGFEKINMGNFGGGKYKVRATSYGMY